MNGKLIGLLIRSNAAMIEAISASARLADKDGTYDENLFWGLRQEVIAMAEEAEAIWSNSNLKFIGRLVSGEKSETWEKVSGLAGTKDQMAISGYESYLSVTGDIAYRPNQQVQHHQRSQANYHDLAAQENGEFTLLTPKKYQGGKTGGVAVICRRHAAGLA